eukprot:COSAG02_NODE_6857_length_3324_cov_17.657674_2_plen_808_part_01
MLGAFGSPMAQFDLDASGRVAVPDLLLILGAFGRECTRQPTSEAGGVPTESTWYDLNAEPTPIVTWGKGVDYCFLQGMELCRYASYCPDGSGQPPVGGTKIGDEWAPVSDQPNRWVQVGSWGGDESHTCVTHDELQGGVHGDPGWGIDPVGHGFMGWVQCCPVGEIEGTCLDIADPLVEVSFINDATDTSGNGRVITHTGGNDDEIGPTGAHFDGNGDYLTISDFQYESDATFSVSFWFTKEGCTGGIYEYLYSDHNSVGLSMWDTPYLDVYIGCETSGGGWSTLDGSIVRYWMRDTSGTEAMMDWPLADAGSFDAITSTWVHIILVVEPNSIKTFDDGTQVPEQQYGFYGDLPQRMNAAAPSPHALSPPFTAAAGGRNIFEFGELHVGGRADHNDQRRFLGHMALLVVYPSVLTGSQASCLFDRGEQALPYPTGESVGFQDASGQFDQTSWGAAVDYCIAQGTGGLCPLSTYCPDGPGSPPFGGTRQGNQWAPYVAPGKTNKWVQVGVYGTDPDNTCRNHNQLLGSVFNDPTWGADSAEVSAGRQVGWIMCCSEASQTARCLAGDDCGGQVMKECGTACPNVCGVSPLTPGSGRRQLTETNAPTCSSLQRGMVLRCIYGAESSTAEQSPCEQCADALPFYHTIVGECVLAIRSNQDLIQPRSLPLEADGQVAIEYMTQFVNECNQPPAVSPPPPAGVCIIGPDDPDGTLWAQTNMDCETLKDITAMIVAPFPACEADLNTVSPTDFPTAMLLKSICMTACNECMSSVAPAASTVQVNVQITTLTWANEITWNVDGGTTFGPYEDNSV